MMARPSSDPVRRETSGESALVVLSRDVAEVGRARRWLLDALVDSSADHQLSDACLVTSELVTNALRHGLGEIVLHASLADDGLLRLSVTDWGEGSPQVLPPDPERIGGVGLLLVDALSEAWGVATFPGGKTVWASIGLPAAVVVDERAVQSDG
jgi:anti-sigma regulatory factor (Ser/Thr protein kinase)